MSKLVHALPLGTPKFYIAPYDKINHRLVNFSSNRDVKSGLSKTFPTYYSKYPCPTYSDTYILRCNYLMVFRCILILDKSRLWTPIITKCSFLLGNSEIISQLFSNKLLSVSFAIHISSIFSNYFSELGKNMFRYISVQITNDNNSSLMLLMTKLPLLIQNKVYHF